MSSMTFAGAEIGRRGAGGQGGRSAEGTGPVDTSGLIGHQTKGHKGTAKNRGGGTGAATAASSAAEAL